MLGCWIFHVQSRLQQALNRIHDTAAAQSIDNASAETDTESVNIESGDEVLSGSDGGWQRRRRKRDEPLWENRDKVRTKALGDAEAIAIRMDELMLTPPYSDSAILLHLRGMVSLWIADLVIPEPGPELETNSDNDSQRGGEGDGEHKYDAGIEERMTMIRRRGDREKGLKRKLEEVDKAKECFRKVEQGGGRVWVGVKDIIGEPTNVDDRNIEMG
jgi:hypothetical protein